ncbi:MAG: hypothetical protein AB7S75_06050 [Desulfococcaceae bacterium]
MKKILICSFMLMALLFGNMANAATKVLLEDDFNDGVLDTSKWVHGVFNANPDAGKGDSVVEANGILRVSADTTDWVGLVYTKPIPVNREGKIIIRKRIKAHYANEFYSGANWLADVENDNKRITEVDYRNYVYTYTAIGFGYTPLLTPIWDEWVDELWEYDPKTGVTTYTLNNNEVATYTIDTLKGSTVSYSLNSYGWWTGHYIETDYIIIEQEQSGTETIEKIFGGSLGDAGYAIDKTSDGNYIIAGFTNFNGNDSAGDRDFYLVKIDGAGNIIWEKAIGGAGDDYAFDVIQTSDGGYAVSGRTNSGSGTAHTDFFNI